MPGFAIDKETRGSFAGRYLLLDTNALIDAYRLPEAFYDLANELVGLDCALVATKSVILEFIGGTRDKNSLQKKVAFLEALFNRPLRKIPLPLSSDLPSVDDVHSFSKHAQKFSIGDFELYCAVKKYKHSIAILTRNHKDFPNSLLHRISFITLLGNAEIHTYSVSIAPD